MQLTDAVHWRYVYDRDGRLRSYSMGTKKIGKWAVEKDELCLYLGETDDGCYAGVGLTLEGVLQTPADRNWHFRLTRSLATTIFGWAARRFRLSKRVAFDRGGAVLGYRPKETLQHGWAYKHTASRRLEPALMGDDPN
jgi:hypothetical protein